MTQPRISICIANYNGLALIDDCIQSVQSQAGIADEIEIIIHDDASTDGSATYIRNQFPHVHLIESEKNVGFCVANNRMAEAARGKYLLLLNNDAILLPDALETLLHEAQRLDLPAILSLPQYDADTGELLDVGSRLDPFLNPVPNLDLYHNDVAMVMGACLWIDKLLWDELGGFPEWFGSIGEDLYLCCRARLAGYSVQTPARSGYRHHVGKSFGGGKTIEGRLSSTFRRRALSERNKTFVMVMTYPMPFMQIALPAHLLVLLLEGSLLALLRLNFKYLGRIYLPAVAGLFHQRRMILAERRKIMLSRRLTRIDFFAPFVWLPYKIRMLWRHGLPIMR
jgi:GT2 family glycosyltransferase